LRYFRRPTKLKCKIDTAPKTAGSCSLLDQKARGEGAQFRALFLTNATNNESLVKLCPQRHFEKNGSYCKVRIMRVLVADDSGIMRKIITRSLNACGVSDIVETADGKEALNAFKAEPVDIVLTDWNMPEMTGLELLQAIRASGSEVPVIMITTEGDKASVIQAIQAGVTDYLCKPFEQEELRDKLEKYVAV
jgi:two-component system, chemotaxis family, chemotaxis protein CheY